MLYVTYMLGIARRAGRVIRMRDGLIQAAEPEPASV
jgi:hypothetical protein